MTGLVATMLREYRLLTRNRTNLLLSIAPTAIYLLLFTTSLSHLVPGLTYRGRVLSYQEFAIPAIMLSSMLAAATTAGTSLFQEELGGMAIELWSHPLRRGSYVLGKLVASSALVLAQSLVALVVGTLIADVGWTAGAWAALLLGTVVAAFGFSGGYLLLATLVRDFQRFMVLINVVGPVMLFASPSFYPAEQMPPAVRWLSAANPVTYGIRCLRDGALFGLSGSWPWLLLLAGLGGIGCGATGAALLRRASRL
jgi:ABC-2 type transport system permease protein